MKPALQAKLLHVLQDAEFTKLGSNKKINVDVRVVTATNRDLEQMMVRGEFREDLYYRLKVIEAYVPPLRERRDEIQKLTDFFLAEVLAALQPAGAYAVRGAASAVPDLRLAWQRPRARKHDQAVRHPAGRVARHSRAEQTSIGAQPTADRTGTPSVSRAAAGFHSAAAGCRRPSHRRLSPQSQTRVKRPMKCLRRRRPMVAVWRTSRARPRFRQSGLVIADTLRQVHWNRRKAAQLLGVSYKTLLNKIKETGIERP